MGNQAKKQFLDLIWPLRATDPPATLATAASFPVIEKPSPLVLRELKNCQEHHQELLEVFPPWRAVGHEFGGGTLPVQPVRRQGGLVTFYRDRSFERGLAEIPAVVHEALAVKMIQCENIGTAGADPFRPFLQVLGARSAP